MANSATSLQIIVPIIIAIAHVYVSHANSKPNIVFIMGESIASSAYFFGKTAPMPIPNIQWLMKNGVSFPNTYSASPCCNPSRSTTITGRHAHKHGHYQLNPNTNLYVNGTWNNHEGLDPRENNTFFNFTSKYANYNYKYFGKVDWTAGEHSLSCRVTAWCNKVNFPYTLNKTKYDRGYGWYDEHGATFHDKIDCNEPGPNCTQHSKDWEAVQQTADWILSQAENSQPFLAYWGSWIVHPPYGTTKYWLNQVNEPMIIAPEWVEIDELHPEDFQSSMKKKFLGDCCSDRYKKEIRAHYYANIAEYDAMIGVILDALRAAGVLNNTWIIATSDHGDMKMEHQQFYKMVFYDSSTKVPSIIYGGDNFNVQRNVIRNDVISSMLDYFPTMMDMAGVQWNETTENVELDGYSLMPYVMNGNKVHNELEIYDDFEKIQDRPNYVMSQFHGDEIHLSWFMLRQNEYKYVVYGSGHEVAPRLFNVVADPDEMNDLAVNISYKSLIESMDGILRTIIDYPAVAENVEKYNKESFVLWKDSFHDEKIFNDTISTEIRWRVSWEYDSEGSFNAINEWLKTPNDTFFWALS